MPVAPLSRAAEERLRRPRTRGAFQPRDAARRQLGLLSVADPGGQARIFWLVDLATRVVEDSRFLAFGDLASHPLCDAFTELARGRTVEDACRLDPAQIEQYLRDVPATPAAPAGAADFLRELQALALAELPRLRLLPRPAEAPAYERKRRQDWDERDLAWLPLGLLQKMQRVQAVADRVLSERFGAGVGCEITGLHQDFQVQLRLTGLAVEQAATAERFLGDALRSELHAQLALELAP